MFARIDLSILVILFCFCNFCTLVFYFILSLPPLFPLPLPLHIYVIVNIELNNDHAKTVAKTSFGTLSVNFHCKILFKSLILFFHLKTGMTSRSSIRCEFVFSFRSTHEAHMKKRLATEIKIFNTYGAMIGF